MAAQGRIRACPPALDDAEQALRHALAIVQGIGEARQLWKAHEALARPQTARGHADAAREFYGAGRTVIQAALATTPPAGLRAGRGRRPGILRPARWLASSSGAALGLTAPGIDPVGDWLSDVLDPKLRV